VFELMEGSSRFRLDGRDRARAMTGLAGDPLCLWVGRLDANKDPLTVLRGFEIAVRRLPEARLVMVYDEEKLLPEVKDWLAGSRLSNSRNAARARRRNGYAAFSTRTGVLKPSGGRLWKRTVSFWKEPGDENRDRDSRRFRPQRHGAGHSCFPLAGRAPGTPPR